MSDDVLRLDGTIVMATGGGMFQVDVQVAGKATRVLARRGGKLVIRKLQLCPGDKVAIELSPYDLTRGRIMRRLETKDGGSA
jgi:translation initiation factor IF-1